MFQTMDRQALNATLDQKTTRHSSSRKPFQGPALHPRLRLIACILFLCLLTSRLLAQDNTPVPSSELSALPYAADEDLMTSRGLVKAGKLPEAEAALRSYVSNHLNSAEAHFLLGLVLFREDKPKDSLVEFTSGARYQTPSAGDLKVVGLDYVLLDDYVDANKWLTQSTERDPLDPTAWYSLGRVQYKLNFLGGAMHSFEKAIELDPQNVKAEDNLGLTLQALNRPDDAIVAYRKALSLQENSPHPSEQPLLNLGSLLMERNESEEATRLLEKAVAIAPRDAKVHEQLGRAYLLQNQLRPAADHLEQAVALSPNDSRLHFQLGQVYRKLGLAEKAKAEFQRTETLNGARSTPQ